MSFLCLIRQKNEVNYGHTHVGIRLNQTTRAELIVNIVWNRDVEYDQVFTIINNNNKLHCMVCIQVLLAPKKCNMKRSFYVKRSISQLENQIIYAKFLLDLSFLIDLTSHINKLNLKLQGNQYLFI